MIDRSIVRAARSSCCRDKQTGSVDRCFVFRPGPGEALRPSRREGLWNWSSALIYNALSRGGEAPGIPKIKQTTCQPYEIRKIGIEVNKAPEQFVKNCKLVRHSHSNLAKAVWGARCAKDLFHALFGRALRCCSSR